MTPRVVKMMNSKALDIVNSLSQSLNRAIAARERGYFEFRRMSWTPPKTMSASELPLSPAPSPFASSRSIYSSVPSSYSLLPVGEESLKAPASPSTLPHLSATSPEFVPDTFYDYAAAVTLADWEMSLPNTSASPSPSRCASISSIRDVSHSPTLAQAQESFQKARSSPSKRSADELIVTEKEEIDERVEVEEKRRKRILQLYLSISLFSSLLTVQRFPEFPTTRHRPKTAAFNNQSGTHLHSRSFSIISGKR